MSNRRPKYIVTLLLLVSAIFASISYINGPQPVLAVGTVTLTPSTGQPGQTITFTGASFPGTPTTCSISGSVVGTNSCTIQGGQPAGSFVVKSVSPGPYTVTVTSSPGGGSGQATFTVVQPALNTPVPPSGPPGTSVTITNSSSFASSDTTCSVSGSPVQNGACTINSVTQTVTATFIVRNIAPATYVVTVSGSPIGDSAQTQFTVTANVNITIQPPAGPASTLVNVTGFISPSDTTCSISGTPVSSASCVMSGGAGHFNATFVAGNVAVGPYTITVSGNTGDSVKGTFTVTAPSITLTPNKGVVGTSVAMNGQGFSFKDTTCTISSTTGNLIKNPGCSVNAGTGNVVGSFNVGNVAVGTYVVRVSGNLGDFATAAFNVTAGPQLTLNPTSGGPGQLVNATGTGYAPSDTTCSISGTGSIVQNGACSIASGSGAPTAHFNVGNVAPGTYTITVSGSPGGDSAQATFIVTTGPSIILTPSKGAIGIQVLVNGTGYLKTDNHCTISGTGGVVTNAACSVVAGSGKPSGFFVVGNVVPGFYIITLSATPGGDSAQAAFNVTSGPSITLIPAFGPPGAFISVAGTSFSTSDHSCTITGASGVVLSQSCTITAGSKTPTGNFVVGFVVPGSYLITLTGNTGDSASAIFRVTNVSKTLTLFPAKAPNGATVTFRGTGFNSSDTSCSVETNNPGFNNLLITSPTCTMSATVATGSFVVGPLATEDINWNVTVRGLPLNDIPAFALFNVTATIVISPTTGNIGTVFSFTGSGFESTAFDCTTLSTFQPALGGATTLPGANGGCGMNGSSGQLTGSFTPPIGTFAGVYVLVITDNTGSSASAAFTIGTPSAQLTISPNVITQPFGGQTVFVGITGSGFNAGDTACSATPAAAGLTYSACSISGGVASVALTIGSSVVPGLYLITVTSTPSGSFASNYLSIQVLTTATSTTSTTSTSSTATTTTTLTTFTSISSSLTTTTITSTGPTTIVFQQGTQTTVSAVLTTTSTTTGFTAFPTTQTTTTLQTVTFGQVMQPSIADGLGLLGMLLLIAPVLLRRLLK